MTGVHVLSLLRVAERDQGRGWAVDPAAVALDRPDAPALVMHPSGERVTWAELDERSRRLAHVLRAHGAAPGGCVATVLPPDVHGAEVVWAGLRGGLHVAALDFHQTPGELAPQLVEAAPAVVVTRADLVPAVHAALDLAGRTPVVLAVGASDGPGAGGALDLDNEVAAADDGPLEEQTTGARLLFSSGSTGRPRPHRQPLLDVPPAQAPLRLSGLLDRLGLGGDDVFLSCGPPYHAAPFAFTHALQQRGATVVQLERFDAAESLRALERHGCTASQWVPTMLRRVLALPEPVRHGVDLSRHRVAVHSGAPCPVDLKARLLAEWGPVVHEYYGASEGFGHTHVSPQEWQERPGTVGRVLGGRLHVTDDAGLELPTGEIGLVWFEQPGARPAAHPDLTAEPAARRVHPAGWRTAGDRGRLDADGYLWLHGRAGSTIISGGVNVEPQEVEEVLLAHRDVADAAVLGEPDEDLGQRVRALVRLADGVPDGPVVRERLTEHCRSRLSGPKRPRRLDVVDALPVTEAGKLQRPLLAAVVADLDSRLSTTAGAAA